MNTKFEIISGLLLEILICLVLLFCSIFSTQFAAKFFYKNIRDKWEILKEEKDFFEELLNQK